MTPIDEILRGLDDLVRSGKVHYIGISDTPAWIVSRANAIAELKGLTSFIGLQVEYNLLQRTPERDLIPMAKELGLALTPWAPLAGGALTGKYLKGETGRVAAHSPRRNDTSTAITQKVVEIAEKLDTTAAIVASRWTMQQPFTSIPVMGAKKASQMKDSLNCIHLVLPDDAIQELNDVSKIEMGFPHDFLANPETKSVVYGGTYSSIIK